MPMPPEGWGKRVNSVKVLVVDDRDRVRLGVARVLRRDGCTVRTATSVAHALVVLARESFDLVVTESFLDIDPMGPVDPMGSLFNAANGARIIVVTGTGPPAASTDVPRQRSTTRREQVDIEAMRGQVRAILARSTRETDSRERA
jgi:DNA-binding NtrC family response regulator